MKTPGLLVGSILLTACSVESVEPVDEPSYPSLEPTSRLSAPMQPREEMALPAYAPHDSAVTTTSDTPELDVRWPHLHLARGEGYPESMMLTLPEQIHAPWGELSGRSGRLQTVAEPLEVCKHHAGRADPHHQRKKPRQEARSSR